MKKLVLTLLAVAALGSAALGEWAEIELEAGGERRAGRLGKVETIEAEGTAGVAVLRATWTNVAEVVTTRTGSSTNTTTVTNWYRVKAGVATNGLASGDFVRPDDVLRETNGAAWTSVILGL